VGLEKRPKTRGLKGRRTVRRFPLGCLTAIALALFVSLPPARADDGDSMKDIHPNMGGNFAQPAGGQAPQPDVGDKPEKAAPAFAYFVAVVAVAIVLCVICVPSRKGESSTSRR
jgi:hypothetical protein